jgi:diaminopropionate ammonia-lyase
VPRPAPAGLELVTATNGNQGRVLAHVGRLLGLPVRVFVPDVVHAEAVDAIRAERAKVVVAAAPA